MRSQLSRAAFPTSVLVLILLALLPLRAIRWTGWFADKADAALTPISDPLSRLSRWLSPAAPGNARPGEVLALEEARDRYELLWHQERERNQQLERLIEELQAGLDLNPDAPASQLGAAVVGVSSDQSSGLLKVRAGARHGVELGTVAATQGVHLVGRVERVTDRLCWVRPITDAAAGRVEGAVIDGDARRACSLLPTRDGRLRGLVAAGEAGPALEVGQTVRLSDPGWHRSAQMLVIGRIAQIEPAPDQPLRSIITVEPIAGRLDRVSEVLLRIVPRAEEGP